MGECFDHCGPTGREPEPVNLQILAIFTIHFWVMRMTVHFIHKFLDSNPSNLQNDNLRRNQLTFGVLREEHHMHELQELSQFELESGF